MSRFSEVDVELSIAERSKVLEQLRDAGHNPPTLGTCRVAGTVARAFEPLRRINVLSFGHHQAAASLETEEEQDWLLARAQTNGWTCAQMRDEVRRYKLEKIRRPKRIRQTLSLQEPSAYHSHPAGDLR